MEFRRRIAKVLQERLVQTCIDYFRENPWDEVDEISFSFDDVQDSVIEGSWSAASDSHITLWTWNLRDPEKYSRDQLVTFC